MSDWHVPDRLLADYVGRPAAVDGVHAASIEQHLTVCSRCQLEVARLTPAPDVDQVWSGVADRVDQLGAGLGQRLLGRLGFEAGPARLLAATPALRMGTLAAVTLTVAAVVWASRAADAGGVFLVLAPILPTALVALSFAPGADPAGECGLPTPLYGFAMLMRRALTVEIVALVVLGIGALFAPVDGARAAAWILPALALSVGTVAAAVRWPAPHSAAALLGVWLASVGAHRVMEPSVRVVDAAMFGAAGQLAAATVTLVGCAVIATHRQVLFQEATR